MSKLESEDVFGDQGVDERFGGDDEDDRGQFYGRRNEQTRPHPQGPVVMSGARSEKSRVSAGDRPDLRKGKDGALFEPPNSNPKFSTTGPYGTQMTGSETMRESPSPNITGHESNREHFGGNKKPERSSIPREEGKGKGKAK